MKRRGPALGSWALGFWALPLALAMPMVVACDQNAASQTPGGADADPGSVVEAGGATADPSTAAPTAAKTGKDGKPLPRVRDRDPEEERKKMSLSRQRSGQARALLRKGQLSAAVAQARQALRVHEQNVDAMVVLAEVFYKQGRYELTLAVTDSALSVDPKTRTGADTSQIHNLRGFVFLAQRQPTLATQSFRKAAETDDKNAAAWNNLGARYLAAGDLATAVSCFQYATELKPGFANAQLNYGSALRAQRKWTEAERAFKKALKLRPSWAEAQFNLGVLYLDADPFPGLETIARLNRAIMHLGRYRELAKAGPRRVGTLTSHSVVTDPRAGQTAVQAPPPVSLARADDYIRVAKKGIEREKRRQKRAAGRKAKAKGTPPKRATDAAAGGGAKTPAAGATPVAKPAKPAKPATPGGSPAPQKPGGSPAPQKPGASPAPKKPGGAPAPQKPGGAPSPKKPGASPAPQKPGVQKPPPQKPGVQKPAPQKPTPQKPGVQRPAQPKSTRPSIAETTGKNQPSRGTRDVRSTLTPFEAPLRSTTAIGSSASPPGPSSSPGPKVGGTPP